MNGPDQARFYTIDGRRYVSVTTVLSVIAKPALGPWYAAQERERFRKAMQQALRARRLDRAQLLDRVLELVRGAKAAERTRDRAKARGSSLHEAIAEYLRGRSVSPEPEDRAAFAAWRAWWDKAQLEPLLVEELVWSPRDVYAGTLDLYAKSRRGTLVLLDWKTAKAVYPEHHLQNVAYRAAAQESRGLESHRGAVVLVPRGGGPVSVQVVPSTVTLDDFLAALRLWRWWRTVQGLPIE